MTTTEATTTERKPYPDSKRVFLRVKLKSLREEAKIIRHEERKRNKAAPHSPSWQRRIDLYAHRRELGIESRHTLVAYAFVRGMPYATVERTIKPLDPKRLLAMASKYGDKWPLAVANIEAWLAVGASGE